MIRKLICRVLNINYTFFVFNRPTLLNLLLRNYSIMIDEAAKSYYTIALEHCVKQNIFVDYL